MNLTRKIGNIALIIGTPMVIIGEAFNLIENDLNTKQMVGAYISICSAILIFVSVKFSIIGRNK